jgi:pimeloyl-ACP methyl ester carboxylesterase
MFVCLAGALHAQEITGNWQGTVDVGAKLRVILQIAKRDDGTLRGSLYSIDQFPEPIPVTALSFANPTLKFTVDPLHISYEGKLASDGKTVTGTLTQDKAVPLTLERPTPETAWKIDTSPHTVQMIPVDKGVKLEVLDWGGTGRPLVLLTGLGDTAHAFDQFAPKLIANYHVYGITRRGFGASSAPEPDATNYTAGRLGEDVLAVIDALHLNKPVVAGHSVAGEELSYIGVHHPEKVAGLIYIDAGYPYALYDEVNGALMMDAVELRKQLSVLSGNFPADPQKYMDDLIANLQRVEKEVAQQKQDIEGIPPPPPGNRAMPPIPMAIRSGQERFTTFHVPALVIFADPHDFGGAMKDNPKARAAMQAANDRDTERQAVAFERQVPSAHVVRIPNASHYVFRSNEADVLREMNAFISTLPAQ